MRWYKRDPDAAIAGMIGLSLEERAIYNTVIDLLYSRDGELPSDEHFFAHACGCSPRIWRRICGQLVEKGKLRYRQDGKLTANRVEEELKVARKRMGKEAGSSDQVTPQQSENLGPTSSKKPNDVNATSSKTESVDPSLRAGEHPQPHPQPHPDKEFKIDLFDGKGRGEHRQRPPPRHGTESRKHGTIFILQDSEDWQIRADDFKSVRGAFPIPDRNGGFWFQLNGEAMRPRWKRSA